MVCAQMRVFSAARAFTHAHKKCIWEIEKCISNFLTSVSFKCAGSAPSILLLSRYEIGSAEGVQHGDPLAPLLSCLASEAIVDSLSSELNIWFMDDGTWQVLQSPYLLTSLLWNSFGNHRVSLLSLPNARLSPPPQRLPTFYPQYCLELQLITRMTVFSLMLPGFQVYGCHLWWKDGRLKKGWKTISTIDVHNAHFLLTRCLTLPSYFLRASLSFSSGRLREYDETEVCI